MIWVFIVQTLADVYAHDAWDFYNDVRQGVDRSKLIADTVLLCGIRSVCNQSAIPFPVLPVTEQEISGCGPCSCDVDCWSRGDCCVDLPYLYLTSSCQSTQLIFNGSNAQVDTNNKLEMIASCPEKNLYLEMKEKCDGFRNDWALLDNDIQAPVTSVITHVTYRNKYCAMCHGDHDVIRWDRFAECETPFDINIISTVSEFENAFSENNCFLLYEFPSSVQPIPLRRCIIEWACKNFQPGDVFLEDFQNIFCYICNPSIATVYHDVIIDRCNLTGEWQLYDKGLEDGCLNLPSIRRLRPFKNIYCMLCNGRNTRNNTLQGHLGELSFIISSSLSGMITHVKFSETSLSNLLGNTVAYWERSMVKFDIGVKAAKSDFINGDRTKNIFIKKSSFFVSYKIQRDVQIICAENSVCLRVEDGYSSSTNSSHASMNSNFYNSSCGLCSCNSSCLYDTTCCVDMFLNENTYDCISNEIFFSARDQETSSESGLLAISTCKNSNTPAFIRDMCHQQLFSNLIIFLPGRSNGSVIFKNIFCSYCHDFKDNFQPLDIQITCPIRLEPTMFLSFSSLLRTSLQWKCNVRLVDNGDEGYMNETLMVSVCNTTEKWHDYDESFQSMCDLEKQFSICGLSPMTYQNQIYKDMFCFRCNPNISTQSVIRHCNQQCQDEMESIVWSPYKNWFCKRCNEKMSIVGIDSYIVTQSLRILFSFKLPSSVDLIKEEVACSNGMYDSYKMACTNLYCPLGRELKNESCMVLLEETKHLRYLITFQMVSHSNDSKYDGRLKLLLQNISRTILDMMRRLEKKLNIEYKTWSYHLCEDRQMAENATISVMIPNIFFHAKLHIPFTRNRTALELALLDFRKSTFQLEYNDANFTFESTQSSMIVPDGNDSSTLCTHDYTAFDTIYFQYYIPSKYRFQYKNVSDLLACAMVQVSNKHYIFNNDTETILLINTSTTFQRQNFEFQTDGSIRVCRDHVNQGTLIHRINTIPALPYQTSLMASIYSSFSYVCTVISITCLVITFVTYCLFKTLRSLPGKNNMCLVLCLLCAQILLQFGLWKSHHPIMCQIIAIGIHFFWMATFTSMIVCFFHMYRVFCSNAFATLTNDDSKRFLTWYIAYICSVPFSLILATTTINYSLSDVFFAIAFQKICSSPIIESNSGDKRNLFIYVKLSTITGIAWPLQVIDAQMELSAFSFFVTFLNALQGMFIFASYICNRRVWKLYLECCCRRRKPQ
ncbi:hypothetical protein ACJMK2_024085 [Sinanodonta woodiana]|uniref:G-protein coupled receptors family 2 profile 2 domain-containing protein n=1 Tax=Sinanodonta woodiana TaxID=1069815 RepID=A0ABD3T820_SINWO